MKVAFIKQHWDVFGPWSSVPWQDWETLFKFWPGKASLWEATCLLKADWYVIPQQTSNWYIQEVIKHRLKPLTEKYVTNITKTDELPLHQYDIVITLDPILPHLVVPPGVVFAYFCNENSDPNYTASLRKPFGKYDLFLAHALDAPNDFDHLPAAVSFPYPRHPKLVRKLFAKHKEERVWVEWRTLTTLARAELYGPKAEGVLNDLQKKLKCKTVCYSKVNKSPYSITDPPAFGDAKTYLQQLGACKYYIAVGRKGGAGQGIVDAASAGCLCIGDKTRPYHRIICYPDMLCDSIEEAIQKFRKLREDSRLQKKVRTWQDIKLFDEFVKRPLRLLKKAVRLKRGNA